MQTRLRFFKKMMPGSINPIPRHFSTRDRVPVLMFPEYHVRSAAKNILNDYIEYFKSKGYNTFMCEGGEGGHTLIEQIKAEKNWEHTIAQMYYLHRNKPAFLEIMNRRHKLTIGEFYPQCVAMLKQAPVLLNYGSYEHIAAFLFNYQAINSDLFSQLLKHEFYFRNLDEDYTPSRSRPVLSRADYEYRDQQYVEKISEAYHAGKNVITILGAEHVMKTGKQHMTFQDIIWGTRRLMAERLQERDVPCVAVYPFNRNHVAADEDAAIWQNQICSSLESMDPSRVYAVDLQAPSKCVTDTIDALLLNHQRSVTNNQNVQSLSLR